VFRGQPREPGGGNPGSWPRGSINVADGDDDDDVDDRAMVIVMMVMMMMMTMTITMLVMVTIVTDVDPLPCISVVAGETAKEKARFQWVGLFTVTESQFKDGCTTPKCPHRGPENHGN
jgi:hypothetical protein